MSFNAIRWAFAQPIPKASTKYVLIAMANCVNEGGREWLSWPSYRHIAERTSLDAKTVEAGVSRLKELGYLLDTGRRAGGTGKVVVYKLNTPENGVVITDPEGEGGSLPQHANDPELGPIKSDGNDPEFSGNPPKFPVQRPQISGVTTPKTGDVTSKGTSKRTKKESGESAQARPADVSEQVWKDWTALRTKKRAGVNATTIDGARAEAAKAGLDLERFLAIWVMRGSQGLQADWLKPNERGPVRTGKHAGFANVDYTEGVTNGIPDA